MACFLAVAHVTVRAGRAISQGVMLADAGGVTEVLGTGILVITSAWAGHIGVPRNACIHLVNACVEPRVNLGCICVGPCGVSVVGNLARGGIIPGDGRIESRLHLATVASTERSERHR